MQTFLCTKILAIRIQIQIERRVYFRKHRPLDVCWHVHQDANMKERITLEGIKACPCAWRTIHGISKVSFYRYKEKAKAGLRAEPHGNLGSKKPRLHTLQATANLSMLLENNADRMPHKTKTLDLGEKVVSMCLPPSFCWNETLPEINDVNAQFDLPNVSASGLSKIRKDSFLEYAPKGRGDSFAWCGQCDNLKQLRSACTPGSHARKVWTNKLDALIEVQRAHRELYYANQRMSENSLVKVLTIIHDKMDHSKTASLHFSHKSKAVDSFMKLPVSATSMIAHGHGDKRYAHYG